MKGKNQLRQYDVDIDDRMFHIIYEYEPGEKETRMDPGFNSYISVKKVCTYLEDLKGSFICVDVKPMLEEFDEYNEEAVAEEILEHLKNQ